MQNLGNSGLPEMSQVCETAFGELVNTYYREEGRRIRERLEKKSYTSMGFNLLETSSPNALHVPSTASAPEEKPTEWEFHPVYYCQLAAKYLKEKNTCLEFALSVCPKILVQLMAVQNLRFSVSIPGCLNTTMLS